MRLAARACSKHLQLSPDTGAVITPRPKAKRAADLAQGLPAPVPGATPQPSATVADTLLVWETRAGSAYRAIYSAEVSAALYTFLQFKVAQLVVIGNRARLAI